MVDDTGLWGKPKEGTPIITTPSPNPVRQNIPPEDTEDTEDEEDIIDESEEADMNDPRVKFMMDFQNEQLPELEDDDLSVLMGFIIREMAIRMGEDSDTTGAIVRRLRRVEAAIQHVAAGQEHGLLLKDGYVLCRCGRHKALASPPDDDKFSFDEPRKA